MSFTVHFPGAPPRPVEWLSGGQRSVLATAFWLSVSNVFGTELLVLDEPTAAMAAENVDYLAEALTRYAASIRGRKQVIVISHSPSLTSAYDQCIDLGKLRAAM